MDKGNNRENTQGAPCNTSGKERTRKRAGTQRAYTRPLSRGTRGIFVKHWQLYSNSALENKQQHVRNELGYGNVQESRPVQRIVSVSLEVAV